MVYSKNTDEKLNFYECLQLLEKLIENDIISKDPNNENNVLVYRMAGEPKELNPEGWYTENIFDTAHDLVNDEEGQHFLMQELVNKNVVMEFERPWWKNEGE